MFYTIEIIIYKVITVGNQIWLAHLGHMLAGEKVMDRGPNHSHMRGGRAVFPQKERRGASSWSSKNSPQAAVSFLILCDWSCLFRNICLLNR